MGTTSISRRDEITTLDSKTIVMLFGEHATFTVTEKSGVFDPVCMVAGCRDDTVAALKAALGFGNVYGHGPLVWIANGVQECLRLLEYLGDEPVFDDETLQVYRAWKDLVLHLRQSPRLSQLERSRFLDRLNPKSRRFGL